MMPVITLQNDIRITTFEPPSGFDPLSATALELEQYGFPARPDHPRLLKLYQRVFTRLKGRLKYVEPSFRISRDEPLNRASPAGIFTGDNWSGGVVQPPAGRSFQQVLGHWVVPNASPVAGQVLFNSYWIGLDGFVPGTAEALQAGVDCVTVGTSKGTFYAWAQWAPSPKMPITTVTVSAGDLVMVNISAAPGAGAKTATISFANITSGAATSFAISAPPSVQLAGNSAEWVVEAPGGASQLADYGQVFFADCTACLAGNFGGAGGGTGQKLDITQGSTVISEATLITPLVIQCRYAA
jgi:hypothetical protein